MMGVTNTEWDKAMSVMGCEFTQTEQDAGWPASMVPRQLASLQRTWSKGDKQTVDFFTRLLRRIEQACEEGAIQWSTQTRQVRHQITKLVPGDQNFATRNVYGEREVKPRQVLVWATKDVQVKAITMPAFAAWLDAQGEAPSIHIRAWFDAVGVAGAAPVTSPIAVMPGEDSPATLTTESSWSLKTSLKRAPGYRWPLYQVLKAAHTAGKPCPRAREVLEAWRQNTPPDLQVMSDGVKYSDAVGNTKEADLKAIQQAIKGLLKK